MGATLTMASLQYGMIATRSSSARRRRLSSSSLFSQTRRSLANTTRCRFRCRFPLADSSSSASASASASSSLWPQNHRRHNRYHSPPPHRHHHHHNHLQDRLHHANPFQNRNTMRWQSSLSSLTLWAKDVVRTGSFNPPNPILQGLPAYHYDHDYDIDNDHDYDYDYNDIKDIKDIEDISAGNANANANANAGDVDDDVTTTSTSTSTNNNKKQQQQDSKLNFCNVVRPHHLERATELVIERYESQLAEWERSIQTTATLTTNTATNTITKTNAKAKASKNMDTTRTTSLLDRLDRLEVPIIQLRQVGKLFTELASPPDQLDQWREVYAKSERKLRSALSWRESSIIYEALLREKSEDMPCEWKLEFRRNGAHLFSNDDNLNHSHNDDTSDADCDPTTSQDELRQISDSLQELKDRFEQNEDYAFASKAARLQMVSDLYTWIGTSQLQAQKLGYDTIFDLQVDNCPHMVNTTTAAAAAAAAATTTTTTTNTQKASLTRLFYNVADFLQPHLPVPQATFMDEQVGAFLPPTKDQTSPSEDQKALWKAKYMLKHKGLRLHGVLQGIADFCETIFGIRIVQDDEWKDEGWNPKVRALHLYKVGDKENDNDNTRLGTIYLDPFQDPYWRGTNGIDDTGNSTGSFVVPSSWLFTERTSQLQGKPAVIMALNIAPTWDDVPAPISWDDTQDLLFHFGNALQMILSQASKNNKKTKKRYGRVIPADGATFLANFMEMWVMNDGFLQRLAQLSSPANDNDADMYSIEQETLDILRNDLRSQKSLDLMDDIFRGSLELSVLTEFDPRGDETLAALQARYAQEFALHDLPDKSDLSPLVSVIGENATKDGTVRAYDAVYSSVLAAMVYERFDNVDLTDREEVKRLGHGIRDLFYREELVTTKDVLDLCEKDDMTVQDLKRVYNF